MALASKVHHAATRSILLAHLVYRNPRHPLAPASTRKPTSGACRLAPGGLSLLGPTTLFRGSHRISRCLSRPESTGPSPRHQESTVPANHHQLGHATQPRPYRIGPYAQRLSP